VTIFNLGKIDLNKIRVMKEKKDINGLIKAAKYKKDDTVRWAAINTLGSLGERKAVKHLLNLLKDEENIDIKRKIIEALGKTGDVYCTTHLLEILKNEKKKNLCLSAVKALGEIGDEKVVKKLLGILEYEDKDMKLKSVESLAMIGSKEAVKPLFLRVLYDESSNIRKAAVKAIEKIDPGCSVDPLLKALTYKNPEVRIHAMEALEIIKWEQKNIEERMAFLFAKRDYDGLCEAGEPAVKLLQKLLEEEDKEIKLKIIKKLKDTGKSGVREILLKSLEDDDKEVRRAGAEAIEELGGIIGGTYHKANFLFSKEEWEELGKLEKFAAEAFTRALRDNDREIKIKGLEFFEKTKIGISTEIVVDWILKEMDEEIQEKLIEFIQKTRDSSITARLRELVNDRDKNTRLRAIKTLGFKGSGGADALIPLLNDGSFSIKCGAIESLGKIKDNICLRPLIELFKDDSREIRKKTLDVLKEFGPPAIEALIPAFKDKDEKISRRAVEAFAVMDSPSVEFLTEALNNNDREIRRKAVIALGKTGDRKRMDSLVKALNNDCPTVRQKALEVLDILNWKPKNNNEKACFYFAKNQWKELCELGKAAGELCIQALNEKNFQPEAMEVIEKLDDDSIGLLSEPLYSPNQIIRLKTIEILGKIGSDKALKLLSENLDDRNVEIRCKVINALGVTGNKSAGEILKIALKDRKQEIRKEAVRALKKIGWKPANLYEKAYYLFAARAWAKLIAMGKPAAEILINFLEYKDGKTRPNILKALYKIGDQAIDSITRGLEIKDNKVRLKLLEILEKKGDETIIPCLLGLLDDKDKPVRIKAAKILAKYNNKSAVFHFVKGLKDSNWTVRYMAARALGNIKDSETVAPLIETLKEEKNFFVRWQIIMALGETGDREIVNPIQEILLDTDNDRIILELCRDIIMSMGGTVIKPLCEAIEKNERGRERAIKLLIETLEKYKVKGKKINLSEIPDMPSFYEEYVSHLDVKEKNTFLDVMKECVKDIIIYMDRDVMPDSDRDIIIYTDEDEQKAN